MLNACTIIACNYLPFARVLADSFLAHHPGGSFTILLVDDEERRFTPADDRINWRRLGDIGLDPPEVRRLAGIYDVTELATAVKPLLLRRLLDEGPREVVYLDPDIRIYASLEEVATLAAQHGIVLTPHTMQPYPRDERQIDGFFVLAAGVYNLGFIGVGQSSRPFLDWWWQTTRREALIDPAKMMFTDQRWVDFVPSFFDHYILKDPGYNVAYWNLHGRSFENGGGRYLVNGAPLRFFHFSGFDPRKPWLLSKHQGERPRVLLSERPALARICREYLASLREAGIDSDQRPKYGWSHLRSGIELTTRMRRLYWSALVCWEQGKCPEPPSPFDEANPNGFVDWLNTPAEGGPKGISRFLYSIYRDRIDLQAHFPDIYAKDAESFAEWIWAHGTREEKIPDELLPAVNRNEAAAQEATVPAFREGLNIAGYFRAELGIGEAARQLTNAIETAGLPVATITYDVTLSRQAYPFADRSANGPAYGINVLCVNADSTPRFARDVGPAFFVGRHTAGYWFWEVEQFPSSMHPAFDVVDEVWTATDFIADAVRAVGLKPVYTVPLPVPVPEYSPAITRAKLGLPDRYAFLFIFDFLSVVERKNPQALIEAFTRAFAPDEGPMLVLKSINGDLRLSELERLRAMVGGRSDVRILDAYYTEEEKNALLGACDCYVSLHRSEGLGLTMAEAMALGKPVIATGYSGNLHFMTPENSYLVDYSRVNVPAGCEPYPTTAFWAEPNIGQAAEYMREVYEQPAIADRKAGKARRDILERHNRETSARVIRRRVEAIREERRRRIVGFGTGTSEGAAKASTAASPAVPGVAQLEALLPALTETATLRLSAEGRSLPGVRIRAQRAFFRVLRPLWFQQHQFHTHLVNALRLTTAALRSEQRARELTDARLQELTRNAAAQLAGLTTAVQQTEAGLATLTQKLYATPYMSDPNRFLEKDPQGRARMGYRASDRTDREGFYVGFEEVFRGPEALIRERQRAYLPILRTRRAVVDLGCGRGEMLDVLREAGVAGTGVDIDADMVRHCRTKGHAVEERDALEYLRAQEPNSVEALFSAQVIEHLPFGALKEFLQLCRSRLRPGGVLIAETVNPHALEAFKTFYTDLTHQRPIFPEVALAFCQLAGFEEAHIFFPLGSGDLKEDRRSRGEYAIVATAGSVR